MKDFQKKIRFFRKLFPTAEFLVIPAILVSILFLLVVLDIFIKGRNFLIATTSLSTSTFKTKDIPILKNKYEPAITARAALVIDKDTGAILYSRNLNLRFSPASTAKIMTATIGLEHYKLGDMLEVKEKMNEGSVLGLFKGQKLTFENLLYAMMLPSANDAAFVIAQNYPGGFKKFVDKMNEKASELNLPNTHFEDPAGLIDENDYTTASELARLASYALNNKYFAKVVSTPAKLITDNLGNSYFIFNKNKLLGIDGVNGVKTGFTEEAGDVLVTSKETRGHTIIIVVLKSQDRFADTYELLNLVKSDNVTYLSIHP